MLNKVSKIVAVLLLVLPVAQAQQSRVYREGGNWAQEVTGSLSAAKNLRVKIDAGSVRIEGSSQPNITYVIHSRAYTSAEDKARQQFDHYKISAYVRGDTAWIVAEFEGERPHRFSGEFSITVPRNLELVKTETEGGSVSTTDIAGRVETESGGGSIHLDNIGGGVSAETGGGSIDVGTVGSDVNLHTGGGSIKIAAAKGKIVAESGGGSVVVVSGLQGAVLETGGGSIHVDRCAGRVKASTGGGSIDLGEIGGAAEIDTGGGSIRLASAKGAVHAETGGGSIELNDILSARAETGSGGIVAKFVSGSGERSDSVLETAAGDIVVYLSSSLNISIRASVDLANGHEIHSDFPDIRITTEGGDYGPKTINAEGNLNGGGPVLKVHTTTGDITFRRVNH